MAEEGLSSADADGTVSGFLLHQDLQEDEEGEAAESFPWLKVIGRGGEKLPSRRLSKPLSSFSFTMLSSACLGSLPHPQDQLPGFSAALECSFSTSVSDNGPSSASEDGEGEVKKLEDEESNVVFIFAVILELSLLP